MKRYLLLGCLLLISLASRSQPDAKKTDSLKNVLRSNIADTLRIHAYTALANLYLPHDSTVAFNYMRQAIDHALDKKLHMQAAKAYNDLGFFFEQYGNAEQAVHNYYTCVHYALTHDIPRWAGVAYGNLYFIYKNVDYPKSLTMLDSGLIYATKAGHKKQMANLHNNRGSQLTFLARYDESMADLMTAAKLYQEIGDSALLMTAYSNIGNNYNLMKQYRQAIYYLKTSLNIAHHNPGANPSDLLVNLASSYYQLRLYDSSIYFAQQRVALYERMPADIPSYAGALGDIGLCYYELKDYPRALQYLRQEMEINNKTDPFNYAAMLSTMGTVYAEMKQYDKALHALDEALMLGEEHKMAAMVLSVLQNKAEVLYRMGRSAEAYKLLERSYNMKDTIYNKDMTDKVSELETKYRTAQKESQIERLNKQNEIQQLTLSRQRVWLFAVAALGLMVLLSVYLLQRSRQLKKEAAHQQRLKAQQEEATHAMISAELNERRRIASELHDGIGQTFSAVRMNLSGINEHVSFDSEHHRQVYNKSMHMIDEGCQELRTVSHMMMPELLLKKGFEAAMHELVNRIDQQKTSVSLGIHDFPKRLSQNTEMTLYRISQEIIQNALKHARASAIDIQITREGNNIFLTIEDDGIGFDLPQKVLAAGMGLSNVKSRVTLLKGTVEIDSRPGAGTVVNITLPITDERAA